jgi:hypothetical protein
VKQVIYHYPDCGSRGHGMVDADMAPVVHNADSVLLVMASAGLAIFPEH